jgi:hypothetical protein
MSQGSASDFTSSMHVTMSGVGLSFSSTFVANAISLVMPVPPLVSPATQRRFETVFEHTQALTQERIDKVFALLQLTHMDAHDLKAVSETGKSASRPAGPVQRTVQSKHLDLIAQHLKFATTTGASTSLLQLGCPDGVTTSHCVPDGYAMKSYIRRNQGDAGRSLQYVSLIIEAKSTSFSPVEGLRQGIAEATNVALSLARAGVPSERVCVPVWSTTGLQMKFAVVRLLAPAFPYSDTLSKSLDLGDAADRMEAAWILSFLSAWCLTASTYEGEPRPTLELGLDKAAYFLKPLTRKLSTAGFWNVYPDNTEASLQHMLMVLTRCHTIPALLDRVVLPITIRTQSPGLLASLVFRNIAVEGYRIGLPSTREQRAAFLDALEQTIRWLHDAGVVHLDLFLSNIMWKPAADGTGVLIKLIDWDSVHFLNESLSDHVRDHISKPRLSLMGLQTPPSQAIAELDLVLFRLTRKYSDEPVLQSSSKETLDEAFRTLMCQAARTCLPLAQAHLQIAAAPNSPPPVGSPGLVLPASQSVDATVLIAPTDASTSSVHFRTAQPTTELVAPEAAVAAMASMVLERVDEEE